jgi:heat shock protein HslJ
MKAKSIILANLIAIITGGAPSCKAAGTSSRQAVSPSLARDYKNAIYRFDNRSIKLTNGYAEAAPGSASKIITRYFGNKLHKDLNGDGREDVAFLVTQDAGGSGTFFYVVAGLNTKAGYVCSQAFFIGDRIAPQATESGPRRSIIVNYGDHKVGEPMASQPTAAKSVRLLLNPKTMQFREVAQNFEGEADPSRMTLGMKKWNWIKAIYNDGREITPKQPDKFRLTFSHNGRFSATTDCNSLSGSYKVTENKYRRAAGSVPISFGQIIATKKYCKRSQEADFTSLLEKANGYHFTSKGELIFDLKFDSGSVIFR